MRKQFVVRVILIVIVVILVVSGTVKFELTNLLNWISNAATTIITIVNNVIEPEPSDILVLLVGVLIGVFVREIYNNIKSR